MIGRRRFLRILAGTVASATIGSAHAAAPARLRRWRGVALGAAASISISHEDAPRLMTKARAEIERLERLFSLYRQDSLLSRLNQDGVLEAPPPDMLALLSMCDEIHRRTGGTFDPTVQPLWQLHARCHASGRPPTRSEIERTSGLIGWNFVSFSPNAVRLGRPGAGLTLNGIAQGYIADKVADLFRSAGVSDVLIDLGEIRALGHAPGRRPWTVGLRMPGRPDDKPKRMNLRDTALAVSSPRGTTFDEAGRHGHLLDPRTGLPAGRWSRVAVTAPTAALADGLSTAFCLLPRQQIVQASAGVTVEIE